MFCQHCGTPVQSDWAFCKHCGGAQSTTSSRPQQKIAAQAETTPNWNEIADLLSSVGDVVWERNLLNQAEGPASIYSNPNPYIYVITDTDVRDEEISGYRETQCIYCATTSKRKFMGPSDIWGLVDDGSNSLGPTCLPCLAQRLIEAKESWVGGSRLDSDMNLAMCDEILVYTDRFGGYRLTVRLQSEQSLDSKKCWLCDVEIDISDISRIWAISFSVQLPVHEACLAHCEMGTAVHNPELLAKIESLLASR